jgi:hypothetical protein
VCEFVFCVCTWMAGASLQHAWCACGWHGCCQGVHVCFGVCECVCVCLRAYMFESVWECVFESE